ncbi:MAG: hypothetical protein GXO77_02205 [Calditrichaeota bacterium]|nr:hypothetical protein [Calditrichota bacterium]
MKNFKLSCVLILLIFFAYPSTMRAKESNRLGISLVLSGHIFIGVKYRHFFNDNHSVQFTFYPLLIPGKKFPFAFSTGYDYFVGDGKWQGKLGAEFAAIVSPPDPDQRKILPLLNFTPGFRYNSHADQALGGALWLSYFLKKANRKVAPTGLEFWYDLKW